MSCWGINGFQMGTMNTMQNYQMQLVLRPGDVVVDAGANLGCYTIPFAERVGLSDGSPIMGCRFPRM